MKWLPRISALLVLAAFLSVQPEGPSIDAAQPAGGAATGYKIVGWNNLGMHCMDADFSVLSLLPPYNTIHAQLIYEGTLVTDPGPITVTYQAVADPDGSTNATSQGKTNFWDHALPLYGASLPVDMGLAGKGMPGPANVPQDMTFDPAEGWFIAEGIPITPYDDAMEKNPYPLMRLVARDGSGNELATADIVLPVSDEMDCKACHGSTAGPAARPAAGWVDDPDPVIDYRLNILRLHDERFLANTTFQSALTTAGYSSDGLYTTATAASGAKPILCAICHLSEALPGTGIEGVPALTRAIHASHATVTDPTNGLTLKASANRSACYRCHPGSETRCLRGVMGSAVNPDGSLAIQCQACHGSMEAVGSATRTGWLDEPSCQSCHMGTATANNGQIRYTTAFDNQGNLRTAANQTFATNENVPAAGLSLYRFSRGHGGLYCEACHGSTHAELPSSHRNDNIVSQEVQGHPGTITECTACHGTQPTTVNGGPHGMHPVGQSWIRDHKAAAEDGGASQCRACHGTDYRGTVLSRSKADRTLSTDFGAKVFWRGFQIGCYPCHNGPTTEDANPNRPPAVSSTTAHTTSGAPVSIPLSASDPDGNSLTLRIVSQPAHGTAGLSGTQATYFPEPAFSGSDVFTFAAWDGSTDSNLGSVSITVDPVACDYSISPGGQIFDASGGTGVINVTAAEGCDWTASASDTWITITSGAAGTGSAPIFYSVEATAGPSSRMGAITVAGLTFTVTQEVEAFQFIRGDSDGDGGLKLSDAIQTLLYLFAVPKPNVDCPKAMDFTDNGKIGLDDVINLLVRVFIPGGAPPPEPFPGCGTDSTADDLPCPKSTQACPG